MTTKLSSVPKLPLILLAIFIPFLIGLAIFLFLQFPQNPYKTPARLVTIQADAGEIYSSLETSKNGKLWVPKSEENNGVLVGSQKDGNLYYALVFNDQTNITIDAKSTAKTIAAIHPAVSDAKKVYEMNADFGEITIQNTSIVELEKDEKLIEALKKITATLYENKQLFPDVENTKNEINLVANKPEKNFEYTGKLVRGKKLELKNNWQPVNYEVDEFGPIVQNNSKLQWKISSTLNGENKQEWTLKTGETIRLDKQEAWVDGKYELAINIDTTYETADLINGLLQKIVGQKTEPNLDLAKQCDEDKNNKELQENCSNPEFLLTLGQKANIENYDNIKNFLPLINYWSGAISNEKRPENIDLSNVSKNLLLISNGINTSYKTTFSIFPESVNYKNNDFNVSFNYPGDWEVNAKQDLVKNQQTGSNKNLGDQYLDIKLIKENAILDINFTSVPTFMGFQSVTCTNKAKIDKVGDKLFRTNSYTQNFPSPAFIALGNYQQTYLFGDHPKFDKIEQVEPAEWVELNGFGGISGEDNTYNFCIASVGLSLIAQTSIPSEFIVRDQYAFGVITIKPTDNKPLSKELLTEADKIVLSLQMNLK